MEENQLKAILAAYKEGRLGEEEVLAALNCPGYTDLGFAKVDLDREKRNGFAEVIYCEGKTTQQVVAIAKTLFAKSRGNVLATRCAEGAAAAVQAEIPQAQYHPLARLLTIYKEPKTERGKITVISAGTADLPVAEEAALTAEIMGNRVERLYDVGVAGIHRLLSHRDDLDAARVLIVVAGMDGALPSVVGGLVKRPLIAVPTSVGYGASFGGLAALLAMLNSCAAGISVVNIDNGFGAACAASRINQLV